MKLTPVTEKFVLHWGEMGTRWGINRTVAQIHALLYLSDKALSAEEIAESLGIARSNVSTSLRELQNWGIVKASHVLGDRRDHFESLKDVYEMLRLILNERKRREIDPTLVVLRECKDAQEEEKRPDPYVQERLDAMLEFFDTMSTWYEQMNRLPQASVTRFVKLGDKVIKLATGSPSRRGEAKGGRK